MKFYLVDYMEERNMSKALETVGAVHTHTHTHTHTRHFLTEEKENACNRFDAGSCSYTQNLINDE